MTAQSDEKKPDLLDSCGLSIMEGEVEIGKTYPIFGSITSFISEEPGSVVVKINDNIIASMNLKTLEKVELLKKRAFEPGIFVSKVLETENTVSVSCQTVIFGKKQDQDMLV